MVSVSDTVPTRLSRFCSSYRFANHIAWSVFPIGYAIISLEAEWNFGSVGWLVPMATIIGRVMLIRIDI